MLARSLLSRRRGWWGPRCLCSLVDWFSYPPWPSKVNLLVDGALCVVQNIGTTNQSSVRGAWLWFGLVWCDYDSSSQCCWERTVAQWALP